MADEKQMMNENGFMQCLKAVLEGDLELNESFDPSRIRSVCTYEEAGVMTRNAGLVVQMGDGTEFQITVVRSR